jgi:Zn-dependent protease with chaperone function
MIPRETIIALTLYTLLFTYLFIHIISLRPPITLMVLGLSILAMAFILGVVEPLIVVFRDKYDERLTNHTRWYGKEIPIFLRDGRVGFAGMSIGYLPYCKFIVINRRVFKEMDEVCRRALIAHEMGHMLYNHMAKHVALGIVLIATSYIITVLFGLLASILYVVLVPVILIRYIRKHEREAAGFAIVYVGHENYAAFLRKLRELLKVGGITGFLHRITHESVE